MRSIKRKLLTIAILLSSFYGMAQKTILINNVQIFNGKDEKKHKLYSHLILQLNN
jgi:hypothetical protein